MALVNPEDIYPGYTLTGSSGSEVIGIPLSVLTGLTATEANASTGDIRAVLTALVEKARTGIAALAANARPTNFTVTSVRAVNTTNADLQDITLTVKGTLSSPLSALNYPSES